MSKMRVVQVTRPNGPLEIGEREIPEPGAEQVRVKIEACGICHSDAMTKEGLWPGIEYPRVPGHEIAGVVDAKPVDEAQHRTCFACHQAFVKGHDFVFTRYAP